MLYVFICFCWYSWNESLVTDSYGGNYYDQGEDNENVDDVRLLVLLQYVEY